MFLAGVVNLIRGPQGDIRINKLVIVGYEMHPLLVLGHGDWATTKLVDGIVRVVGLTLEDTSVRIVSLLDFPNNNGLELSA